MPNIIGHDVCSSCRHNHNSLKFDDISKVKRSSTLKWSIF